MIARAWRWAFGSGDFGAALCWTIFAIGLVLAVPALLVIGLAAWIYTSVDR